MDSLSGSDSCGPISSTRFDSVRGSSSSSFSSLSSYSSSSSSSAAAAAAKLKEKKKLISFNKKKKPGSANKTLQQEAVDELRKQATDNTRMSQQRYSQVDMNSLAMLRAQEFQSKLASEYPSFVKFMLKSHVSGGFWLGLPKSFCDMHMPKQNETFSLVVDDVEEHRAKYLVEKNGLSGGWKGFSVARKLVEGDVLVFQLIESRKFKVYIIRACEKGELDEQEYEDVKNVKIITKDDYLKPRETLSHQEDEYEDVKNVEKITKDDYLKPCETQSRQEDSSGNSLDSEPAASLQQTRNGLDSEPADTLQQTENIRLAKSVLEFEDIKGFESFNIIIDGSIIDTEIPIHIRRKYYELCCNQKSFLHNDLVKGLNFKLAAGIISETVNIADAIKAAKVTVSLEHLQSWDKTLKAFEDIGIKVGFMRTCLNKLICLLCEQQEIIRSKKLEQAQLEDKIRDLEGKLSKLCEAKKRLDAEIEAQMVKDSNAEIMFKNIANAAW